MADHKPSYWYRFDVEKLIYMIGGGLILIQLFAYLLNQLFGIGGHIRLGIGFLLIAALIFVTLPYKMLRMDSQDPHFNRMKFVYMFIAAVILIFILLQFRALVPEIFEMSVSQLASMVGLG